MHKVITGIDSFGRELPAFNLRGEAKVNTLVGGVITIVIFALTLSYAVIKAIHLSSKANPQINENLIPFFFEATHKVRPSEINFRAAFSIESYYTRLPINDPHYVKWIAKYITSVDGKHIQTVLPFHKCTAEDLAQFNPVSPQSEKFFREITGDERRGLFCFDEWDDQWAIGNGGGSNKAFLDFAIVPCNVINTQ